MIDPVPVRSFTFSSTNLNNTLPGGSAKKHFTFPALTSFKYLVVPASVPPVPVAHVNASSFPSVCAQISGPVESMCAWRLATLSNWLVHTALGSEAAYRAAWWL